MAVDKTTRNRQNAPSRARYEAKAYTKLLLRVRSDGTDGFTKADIDAAAKADDMSVNAWIIRAINDKLGI